jgi:hypothetical protein
MESIAQRIITKCGGHKAVAEALNISLQRVYCWTYPRERGGTGGTIPSRHMIALRAAFPDLAADDFFPRKDEAA